MIFSKLNAAIHLYRAVFESDLENIKIHTPWQTITIDIKRVPVSEGFIYGEKAEIVIIDDDLDIARS